MRSPRPTFDVLVDLGLRDVGVASDPWALAARLAKSFSAFFVVLVVSLVARCVVVRETGAGDWLVVVSSLAWMGGSLALGLRMARHAPVVVVRVTADRSRGRLPAILRALRPLLEPGEQVLGDGVGQAGGAPRLGRAGVRVVVATDRRLLIATAATEDLVLVDAPYRGVRSLSIAWKQLGRAGVLSLVLADGTTHVITMVPANLMSVVAALEDHGVRPDDPASVTAARRAWDERRRRQAPGRPSGGAGMATRDFDRGLWLLTGLAAAMFYINPFGIGLGGTRNATILFLLVPLLGVASGYVSATRSSLAYLAPLNLLLVPAFFFVQAGDVVMFMILLSVLGALGLWAGSSLRRPAPATPREASAGARLVRLCTVMLAVAMGSVAVAGAAGFPLNDLRLALYEHSARQLPVDGRSDLTGGAASITYTPRPGLHELITDEHWGGGPDDGARWELRSSYSKGYNVVSLAHYVFAPALDSPAAIARFVAGKDREHARLAGGRVRHTVRVVDGRRGYVWQHRDRHGHWYFAAWFPQPVHTVRLECVATEEVAEFRQLCGEAMRSLAFAR